MLWATESNNCGRKTGVDAWAWTQAVGFWGGLNRGHAADNVIEGVFFFHAEK